MFYKLAVVTQSTLFHLHVLPKNLWKGALACSHLSHHVYDNPVATKTLPCKRAAETVPVCTQVDLGMNHLHQQLILLGARSTLLGKTHGMEWICSA